MPKKEQLPKELPKLKGYKYYNEDDFYGYEWDGNCFYIAGRDESMLIGDRLPDKEEEAIQYCRCANRARKDAIEAMKKDFAERVQTLFIELGGRIGYGGGV